MSNEVWVSLDRRYSVTSPGRNRYWPFKGQLPMRGQDKNGHFVWRTYKTIDEAVTAIFVMEPFREDAWDEASGKTLGQHMKGNQP